MKIIRGKKAIVTGAGSGIGRAIAIALAKEGADLCLLDRDEAKLKATAAETQSHGVEVTIMTCDLTQPAQITATVKSLLSKWPRLDILINNAGVTYYGPTELMTTEQVDEILSINLLAPIQLVRELLPIFLQQGEAHILNVSSMFGLVTVRKAAAYQTSKFGLVGFSHSLRVEYARRGIGVTVLCPSFVRTPLLDNWMAAKAARQRHMLPYWVCSSPEHVAAAAIRAIRRNKGLVVISPLGRLLYWLMRLSPGFFNWVMREGWRK